jgi:hypothetical protein
MPYLILSRHLILLLEADRVQHNCFRFRLVGPIIGCYPERASLGLLRSDYMVHSSSTDKIKQIELNTIASSFGGIATHITLFNRYDFYYTVVHGNTHVFSIFLSH